MFTENRYIEFVEDNMLLFPWRYYVVIAALFLLLWTIYLILTVELELTEILAFVLISLVVTQLACIILWAISGGYSYIGSMTETDQSTGESRTVKFGTQKPFSRTNLQNKFSSLELTFLLKGVCIYIMISVFVSPITMLIALPIIKLFG